MTTEDQQQPLYRYRHLQGEHREWTRRILTDSMLYFARPSTFNDPFDCRVHFRPSLSRLELRQKYLSLVRKNMPGLNRAQRRTQVAGDLRHLNIDDFLEEITRRLQEAVDGVGVLSLSATDRNILIWSHYAAGHSGLCLKFLATVRKPFFAIAQPVEYRPNYPEVDLLASWSDQLSAFLLTKAVEWKYEEEWRIIDHDKGPGNKVFPEDLLVGVSFGDRMKPEDKAAVMEWLSGRRSPVQVFQASVAPRSYSLEIEPYKL